MKNSSVINIAKAMQGVFLPKNVSGEVFRKWGENSLEELNFYGISADKKNMRKDAILFNQAFHKALDAAKIEFEEIL